MIGVSDKYTKIKFQCEISMKFDIHLLNLMLLYNHNEKKFQIVNLGKF